MAKYQVMLTDTIYPNVAVEMAELMKIDAEIVRPENTSAAALIATGANCDAILCDYAAITAEVISGLNKCKIIAQAGIGVNNIDIEAAAQKGIMVANVPHYCIGEVADQAMALFLCCAKKITRYHAAIQNGQWDPLDGAPITRLAGQNFCLFGFGAIAQKVARRAHAFEMRVYAYDPYLPDSVFKEEKVKRVEALEEIAGLADVFSIHAPLTPATKQIINGRIFGLMKANCTLINTSRGGLIDEKELIAALQQGRIAAAGLDVLEHEPPASDHPLLKMEQVVMTPHSGFFSTEAENELRKTMAKEVVAALTTGRPASWVNEKYFKNMD